MNLKSPNATQRNIIKTGESMYIFCKICCEYLGESTIHVAEIDPLVLRLITSDLIDA